MLVKYILPRAVTFGFLYQNMYCNFQRLLHLYVKLKLLQSVYSDRFILESAIPILSRIWNIHSRVHKKNQNYPQPVQIIQSFTACIYMKHFFLLTSCSRLDIASDIIFEAFETNIWKIFFWKGNLQLPPCNPCFNNNTNQALGGRIYSHLVRTLANYLSSL